jgi:hypothetical protein
MINCTYSIAVLYHNLNCIPSQNHIRVFSKVRFGIPRNTEFYMEFTLFRVVPQIVSLYNTAKFCGIPYRFVYTEFRIPSNENFNLKKLKKSEKGMEYAAEFRISSNVVSAESFEK